jgi:dolichol-phosphate mannosyltransferase
MSDSKTLGERTLIVTPTYNERSNITEFVQSVRVAAPQADVMIVDDNSPDGTGEIADELSRNDPQVKVMHRAKKLGLGTAYIQAFRRGLTQEYERFVEMDADFSHDPQYLPAFFEALDGGADLVLGSRNIPGGRVEGWGTGRHVLSKGGSLYSRMILGIKVSDLTTGFKAFTRRALEAIELDQVHSNGYSFQVEMTYRALRKGLRIAEVPIVFVDRRVGQSKMDRKIFIEAVSVVWRLRFDALRGRV